MDLAQESLGCMFLATAQRYIRSSTGAITRIQKKVLGAVLTVFGSLNIGWIFQSSMELMNDTIL